MIKEKTFSKTRRIAFVCFSSSYGGLELSMIKLAIELNKRNAECLVIVPPNTLLAHHAVQNKLNVVFLKTVLKYGDLVASFRLARILHSYQTDLVVMMQSKDMSILTIAHMFHPRVKLVFYQEMQSGINKRDLLHAWMHSHLSLWITLTNKMREEVLENTHMPRERITVNPMGTDIVRFNPDLYDRARTREQFGIPQSKLVIGMLGRLDPQKGQEEFLRTIPILVRQHNNLFFIIAGDETQGLRGYKKELKDLSVELGITDCVHFLPFTEAVPEFMTAIDLFVLPSHTETFGFVLVEALAMGKAIVATQSGGVPEIITNGSTGLLVRPQDVQALAEALDTLIKNPETRSFFSLNARAEAVRRFDTVRCVDQLITSLDGLEEMV
jgi:D-inositol-3-phosphate glycosyltransferase